MQLFNPQEVEGLLDPTYVYDTSYVWTDVPRSYRSPDLTENGRKVLERRYLLRNADGDLLETPAARFFNVARTVAAGHNYETDMAYEYMIDKYYTMMAERRFMPNSPTLMNAGKSNGLQLSACYVLPIHDSMEDIFECVKRTALVHQSGGGTGFSFSRLRPQGDFVGTTGGVASGPVSFMTVINDATEQVKQGGTRRGANMGILRVDHPDIMGFIHCKSELSEQHVGIFGALADSMSDEQKARLKRALLENQISNFNISVAITNRFLEALEADEEYELIHPRDGRCVGTLLAREVWQKLVASAHASGDPGLIFIDRMNEGAANPVPAIGPVESTNPCGEQPLYENEACNLGSINLERFICNGRVDWESLRDTVSTAIHFLDGVISINPYPDAYIDAAVKANRRVGLGVMGWADFLIKLGIPYDSEDAIRLGKTVMSRVNIWAQMESQSLARLYEAFPNWERSIYKDDIPRRNSTVTTIAPTGTISIIAGCSSGIEPLFALCFDRRGSLDGQLDLEVYQPFIEKLTQAGLDTPEILHQVYTSGSAQHVEALPEDVRRLFVTAHDVPLEYHVRMQAAFQQFTENAVSKTINLTHEATVEDVDKAYRMAYQHGCMGITVYRDGCKEGVLHLGTVSGVPNEDLSSRPVGGRGGFDDLCPECGADLAREEGCTSCLNLECGWSACSVG
jgi:ribonucleoside-diphosphate reductase alpha chain